MCGEGGGGAEGNSCLKNADKLNFTPVHRQTTWFVSSQDRNYKFPEKMLTKVKTVLRENADKSETLVAWSAS